MVDHQENQTSQTDRIALFIDVDNVLILAQNAGLPFELSLIMEKVREKGRIMFAKAYADWTADILQPHHAAFRQNAIELVQLLISKSAKDHKNTADIQLAVDALEMALSDVSPEVVVIVGGDRDYVPLVQKLKRYGVSVMGIGVEAGVSRVLSEACDSFVYYDDIVPPALEEATETVETPLVDAYQLMCRAIDEIEKRGSRATGAAVHAKMKELSPTFGLERYQMSMKELAESAMKADCVTLVENPGSDFILKTTPNAIPTIQPAPELENADDTAASYRNIFLRRRIPLVPWRDRERLINQIWERFLAHEQAGLGGISLDSLRRILLDYVHDYDLKISDDMVQKLLYTLNFGQCFNTIKSASRGRHIDIPGEVHEQLYPVREVSDAIRAIDREYIKTIAKESLRLNYKAVFELLYGDAIDNEHEKEDLLTKLKEMCGEVRPQTALGIAVSKAEEEEN